MNNSQQPPAGPEPSDDSSSNEIDRPRIVRSAELLQGRNEIWIEHGTDMYRLRVTANDRLYLTK